MPKAPKVKQASRVFKSKNVTEKEAEKVAPLTKYWAGRLKQAKVSDNLEVFFMGVVVGACIIFSVWVLSV